MRGLLPISVAQCVAVNSQRLQKERRSGTRCGENVAAVRSQVVRRRAEKLMGNGTIGIELPEGAAELSMIESEKPRLSRVQHFARLRAVIPKTPRHDIGPERHTHIVMLQIDFERRTSKPHAEVAASERRRAQIGLRRRSDARKRSR